MDWETANDWLIDHLAGLELRELLPVAETLASLLDEDDIEGEFEGEMGDDGYFDDNYPSYNDVLADFEENILPAVVEEYGWDDVPTKREAWNNWTDSLCKNGQITTHQYCTWDNPY